MSEHRRLAVPTLIRGWLVVIAFLLVLLSFPMCASLSLWYWESKGPFKNWMEVVDFEGDGDLDVMVSHTRWEDVSISWAGVGKWINQGNGTFELLRAEAAQPFGGYAAAVGDVDQDGDPDVFTQDFGINLLVNQGGRQGGNPGTFISTGGINPPPGYNQGYRDIGGTIETGDLNGDGRIDAFIAGCCYGMNPRGDRDDDFSAPSVSWVWINESRYWTNAGSTKYLHTGHILPLDWLDGHPIRQAALGDLDGDSDLDVYAAVGKPTLGTLDSLDDLVLLNDGTGELAIFDQPLGQTDSTSVALGDVNGDGRLDALVGTDKGARLWINQSEQLAYGGVLFRSTEQSFEAVQPVKGRLIRLYFLAVERLWGIYLPFGSIRTKAVFLADLDGDKDLDALLARMWGAEIWWNNGSGEFSRSQAQFAYREDTGLAIADFDGDGDQDIFIGRNEVDYQAWWNDGQGGFTTRAQRRSGSESIAPAR